MFLEATKPPIFRSVSSISTPACTAGLLRCSGKLQLLQVAFPYLYNNRPRKVRLAVYHYPMVMYIKTEDPDLPAFYYDPLIHPIAFYKSEGRAGAPPPGGPDAELDEDDEEWALPDEVAPFLEEAPLYSDTTAAVRCNTCLSEQTRTVTQRCVQVLRVAVLRACICRGWL